MSESNPPPWGAGAPSGQPAWGASGAPIPPGGQAPPGAPEPPGPPAPIGGPAATDLPQQPVKGGGRGIFKIVLGVLVIGVVGFTFLRGFIEDSRWKAGACLDYYPTAIFEYDVDANIVDCSDDSARSRIVGEPDADCESLGSVASVTREDKTYCLVRA